MTLRKDNLHNLEFRNNISEAALRISNYFFIAKKDNNK